jgi:hypothetical protein
MIRYKLHHNLSARFMREARQGDLVIEGYVGALDVTLDPERPVLAMEAVFRHHNRDCRPDGRTAPSLSVGDVVTVTDESGEQAVTMTVDNIGWQPFDLNLANVHVGPYRDVVDGLLAEYLRMEGGR